MGSNNKLDDLYMTHYDAQWKPQRLPPGPAKRRSAFGRSARAGVSAGQTRGKFTRLASDIHPIVGEQDLILVEVLLLQLHFESCRVEKKRARKPAAS